MKLAVKKQSFLHYSLVCLAPIFATWLQLLFLAQLQETKFILYYPTVFLVSWYTEFRTGILCVILSTLLAVEFIIRPASPYSVGVFLSPLLFFGTGFFITFLIDRLNKAQLKVAADLIEQKHLQETLEADHDALKLLNDVGSAMLKPSGLTELLHVVLDAAITITKAPKGNIQLFDPTSRSLKIVAQRGFQKPFLDFFSEVAEDAAACAVAMKTKERVIVEDVSKSPIFVGTSALEIMKGAEVQAVQSTPLIGFNGAFLGVFSTHWQNPCKPDYKMLQLVDMLGRKASWAIERKIQEDSIRDSRDEAQRALQSRDEFLSIASHELKTPITSLMMQLQMTQRAVNPEKNISPSAEKLSQVLNTSTRQVFRLEGLVEDLLDVAKIRSGNLNLRPENIQLAPLIREVVERYEMQLQESKCEVKLDLDESVEGFWDRSRIEQVIVNLVSNAVKYAPSKPIEIFAGFVDGQACFCVRDYGQGIEPSKQGVIFERFERATSSSNIAGLGLGLFIVKQIVEGHRGSIELESNVGEGSKFTVKLPLKSSRPNSIGLVTSATNQATLKKDASP